MRKYNFILIVVTMLFSLHSFGQSVKEIDLKINIFPSPGGENGYTIEIKDSIYKASTRKLVIENKKIVFGNVIETKKSKLSNSQNNKIGRLIRNVKELNQSDLKTEHPLDVWVYDLFIEGKQFLILNSLTIHQPEFLKIKELLRYLQKISPIKIKTRHFS